MFWWKITEIKDDKRRETELIEKIEVPRANILSNLLDVFLITGLGSN